MVRIRTFLFSSLVASALSGCEAMKSGAPAIDAEMTKAALSNGDSIETLAAGRRLLATRCTSCHSLEPVERYPAAQWEANVLRMADRAGLREQDTQKVIAYLVAARESL
jgi:nitrate/TMAO reductase-like tetraheme cytochrome c subunit